MLSERIQSAEKLTQALWIPIATVLKVWGDDVFSNDREFVVLISFKSRVDD